MIGRVCKSALTIRHMVSSFKDENYDSEDSCFEVDMVSSASEKSESVDWHPALSSQPVVTTQVSEYQQGNVSYLAPST